MWSLEVFLWYIVFSFSGLWSTHYLNHHLKQGSVRASALSSLLVGLVFHFNPDMFVSSLQMNLPLVFIGTSFIGMSNTRHFNSMLKFIVASVIFAALFMGSQSIFSGYGGKLGLMANVSVVSVIGLFSMIKKPTPNT